MTFCSRNIAILPLISHKYPNNDKLTVLVENGLVIEDDLETETMIGRGMDHVMEQAPNESNEVADEYHHRQRRPKPSSYKYHPQVGVLVSQYVSL